MSKKPKRVIERFDFTDALKLPVEERMRLCVSHVTQRLTDGGLLDIFGIPPIPSRGASEEELDALRMRTGVSLPDEYARFLRKWRYLILDDGYQVWGLDHDGVTIGSPWLSDQHRTGRRYLVFGYYWRYADGDQLLFDQDDPKTPVMAYLHEYPLIEHYAPSFSLALWSMVHEWLHDDSEV
jgi:hypothetical protein